MPFQDWYLILGNLTNLLDASTTELAELLNQSIKKILSQCMYFLPFDATGDPTIPNGTKLP